MKTRRRLFMRKQCPPTETWVVGPAFQEKISLHEVSLGGMKLQFEKEVPDYIDKGIRVRVVLPADYPQQPVITGGEIVWKGEGTCGLKLIYMNCTTLMFQRVIDQLHQKTFVIE